MKALILAGGYGTRLSKVTGNIPKPLVEVGNKSILQRIIDDISNIQEITGIYIVTNEKYYEHYVNYKEMNKQEVPLTILNDGTTSNDNRIGAVGDIKFAVEMASIDEDLLVIAGDSLYDFSLTGFMDFYNINYKTPCICAKKHEKNEELSRFGIVEIDRNEYIVSFEEKPEKPKSDLVGYAIYIFPEYCLKLLDKYEKEGLNMDPPGNFMKYIADTFFAKAFLFNGNFIDIGTPESLIEARELFRDK